jgi:hypothetical protein
MPSPPADIAAPQWSREQLLRMNSKFVDRMVAAIRAGKERPPMVGVDKRPGTKRPSIHRVIDEKPGRRVTAEPGQKEQLCNASTNIE